MKTNDRPRSGRRSEKEGAGSGLKSAALPKAARVIVEEKRLLEFSFNVSKLDHADIKAAWFSAGDKNLQPSELILIHAEGYEFEVARYPDALSNQRGCIHRQLRSSKGDPQMQITASFTDEQYERLVKFSKVYRISFKNSLAALFADSAVVARDEIEAARREDEWLERKAKLPTVHRYHVLWYEHEGRTSNDTYVNLKRGTYWPTLPEERKGHPPFRAQRKEGDPSRVVIEVALPRELLVNLKRYGYELEYVLRGMTSWGRDEAVRPDVEIAWFGRPGKRGPDGMLLIADSFRYAPHSTTKFEIPGTLWCGILNASWTVKVPPKHWIYGAIAGFSGDSHGWGGSACREIADARKYMLALEAKKEGPAAAAQ